MTDACTNAPATPASGNPCQECPFRKSNAGREHPTGNYDDQFIIDWHGIVDGNFFACHVFAPDIHLHDDRAKAMGYVTPVETGERPECAGATLAIQRELVAAKDHDSYQSYIQDRPTGLSRRAFATLDKRIKGESGPEFKVQSGFDLDLIRNPATDVDMTSPYWVFGAKTVARLLNAAGEPATYQAMHASRRLTLADGSEADVDAGIYPLLQALNTASVMTISSCQSFCEVIATRYPDSLEAFRDPADFAMHYQTAMNTGGAYVRFRLDNETALDFLRSAQQLPGVTTQRAGDLGQVDFPLFTTVELTELLAPAGSGTTTNEGN